MSRFPKDCWNKNCEHFHVTDMSVDDLLCACDMNGMECDACNEDFNFAHCPLAEEETMEMPTSCRDWIDDLILMDRMLSNMTLENKVNLYRLYHEDSQKYIEEFEKRKQEAMKEMAYTKKPFTNADIIPAEEEGET